MTYLRMWIYLDYVFYLVLIHDRVIN